MAEGIPVSGSRVRELARVQWAPGGRRGHQKPRPRQRRWDRSAAGRLL